MSARPLLGSSWERRLRADRSALAEHRNERWRALRAVLASNDFYRERLAAADLTGDASADLACLPVLTKQELVDDQAAHPPYGSNLSCEPAELVRFHQTSGTTGQPLRWPDSQRNWNGFLRSWQRVFEGAGVTARDRVLVAFSFGPFIGFWGAFEAAQAMGALAISGGAQTTLQRLEQLHALEATVLVCTPTYALRLAEVAAEQGIDLRKSSVHTTIHAGEPGASVPAVRRQLEDLWGATCWDHAGATEIGAWGYPARVKTDRGDVLTGLFVDETSFVAEFRHTDSGDWFEPATDLETGIAEARRGELVLTALERPDRPVIRYATGDLVQPVRLHGSADRRLFLPGGVLARIDDMFVVRGVNVYPAAIDGIVRQLPEIVEYRATVRRDRQMSEMELHIELAAQTTADPQSVIEALGLLLRERLSLRVPISVAEQGSLPRFELKAQRFEVHEV